MELFRAEVVALMESLIAGLVAGILLGGGVVWLILRGRGAASAALLEELRRQSGERDGEISRLRQALEAELRENADSRARLEESQKSLEEQKALLEAMKKELSDTFTALSSAALKNSNEDFLRLASERLGKIAEETKGRLGEHKASMDGLIKPLYETLKKYEETIHGIELKRRQDYASLDEQIKLLAGAHHDLVKETGNLVTALRKPHVRGRWGEITLRNVVELAGMSAHCDFTEQVSVEGESGRLRPDLVVHMPGGRDIVVDSKVSMEALLESAEAGTEDKRKEALRRHAAHVREQAGRLGSKAYWQQFEKSPELVLLFMGDAAMAAALETIPTLIEDSMGKKVLLATPTTLFALLTAVAYGWRQEQVAENAEAIAALGRELYSRVAVWVRHMNEMGASLERATEAYNRSVGSLESRVLPSVRKFKELGAASSEEQPEMKKVEQSPRNLSLIE